MKRVALLLLLIFLMGNAIPVKAQCYGTISLDTHVNANGSNTVNITTTYANELIMISYDGWPQPGAGPVKVDGNAATHIVTGFDGNNSGIAEVYAYSAPTAGVHTIVCTETNYSYPPYGLNFAASFYETNALTPLSVGSLTSTVATITCTTGGYINGNITTSITGTMIYADFENNNGQNGPFTDSWTGPTFLDQLHEGNGIDASQAYEPTTCPGTYTVHVGNNAVLNNGCGGLVIDLIAIPPTLSNGPCTLTVTPTQVNPTCNLNNGSISFTVSGGNSPYTYSWSPNVSSSASASALSAGTYTVTIKDAACHSSNEVITLVTTMLSLTANATQNDLCYLDCNGSAAASVSGGTPPFTYSWTPSGATATSVTGLCAGTYTITATDALGCTNSATVTITQPPQLTASTQVSDVLCYEGNSGSATAVPSGGTSPYTYSWIPTGQKVVTAVNLTAGIYIVDVTDNNGCTASAEATLTQPAQLMLRLTGPQVICAGTSGILSASPSGGTSPYAYNWSSGSFTSTATVTPVANTTYSCMVTDANGCTVTASILVDLGPPLIASISGPASSCSGNPVALCGHVSGGTGGYGFTWQPGNLSGRCVTVYPASTTTYYLKVTDDCGGDTTVSATVFVNPLPLVSFQSDVQQGCSPLCIQFSDLSTVVGGNNVDWSWNFGNGDSVKTENPLFCYSKPGTFAVTLTATSDSGCSSSLTLGDYVSVYSHPATNFIASPQPTTILSPEIQFTDKTTDRYGLVYWFWNFGDNALQPKNQGKGGTSNLEDPMHIYSDTGTYCVRLVAMNVHGCTDTTTNCLVISPMFNFYIPSAFTPNGDGLNDVFQPKGSYITNFEMYIFDRWGNQLFHTTNINNGWNGTANGGTTVVQEDTYIYQVNVTDTQNKTHSFVGQVNLIK